MDEEEEETASSAVESGHESESSGHETDINSISANKSQHGSRRQNIGQRSTNARSLSTRGAQKQTSEALKSWYRDGYRQLLNQQILERKTYLANHEATGRGLGNSYVNLSRWTSEEKNSLFEALARHGRTQLQAVIAAIPTKSEPEVLDYVNLLHEGATELSLVGSMHKNIAMEDIPASIEVDDECYEGLESAANALRVNQYEFERNQEISVYGNHAILDRNAAEALDDAQTEKKSRSKSTKTSQVSDGQSDDDDHNKSNTNGPKTQMDLPEALRPAIELLKLSKFIELSEQLFMTFANIDPDDLSPFALTETPGVFASALIDLHKLIVELVKRVILAALFQATSRLRATDYPGKRQTKPEVTTSDVLAALEIVGWPQNWFGYWIGIARRNNLRVFDMSPRDVFRSRSRSPTMQPMAYDEVEAYLAEIPTSSSRSSSRSGSRSRSRSVSRSRSRSVSRARSMSRSRSVSRGRSVSKSPAPRTPVAPSSPTSSSSPPSSLSSYLDSPSPEPAPEIVEDPEDIYLEEMDMRASRTETLNLWRILKRKPPVELTTAIEEDNETPLNRPRKRRRRSDLQDKDWRQYTTPQSAWEELGHFVEEEAFEGDATERREKAEKKWKLSGSASASEQNTRSRRGRTRNREDLSDESAGDAMSLDRSSPDGSEGQSMASASDGESEEDVGRNATESMRPFLSSSPDPAQVQEVDVLDELTSRPNDETQAESEPEPENESESEDEKEENEEVEDESESENEIQNPPEVNTNQRTPRTSRARTPVYAFEPIPGIARAEDLQDSSDEWRSP